MGGSILSARRVLDLDFDEISRWFDVRGKTMPHRSLFPSTGFIVNGIAAGFVYFTDSNVAIIEGYISNPHVDSKTRSNALDIITAELLMKAKSSGYKLLKCDTQLEAIKIRAKKHGFKPVGSYESFVLEI